MMTIVSKSIKLRSMPIKGDHACLCEITEVIKGVLPKKKNLEKGPKMKVVILRIAHYPVAQD